LWQDAVAENRSNPAYLVEEDGGWREVSQQEAAIAIDELAHGLLALGVKKGDSWGILARTRLEWVLLDFALAQIGAVAAPIYPSSTASEACYILEHANVVGCLVEDDEQLGKIEAARPEHVYTLETLDELRALGRRHASAHPDALDEARAEIDDDDLFTFIYTSGTTGPPKACMILNRNYYEMVGRIDQIENFFLPSDVLLLYLPLAHNFGRLNPRDPRTSAHLGELLEVIADLPSHRIESEVSAGVLLEAGILSGLVFRLGGFQPGQEVAALSEQRDMVANHIADFSLAYIATQKSR